MTIRSFFIRVFTYVFLMMGAQCALAEESAFFNVVVKGSSLINITTTVPNKTYANAGIKINSPSYSLAGVGTECTQSPTTGYCLFSVSDTASKNISLTGSGNTLSLTLCLDGTGNSSSTCQNYNVSMVITKPRFAYFNNDSGSAAVEVCALSQSTGLITSCQDAGFGTLMGSGTLGITLNSTSTLAYITYEGTTSPYMFQCAINPLDGTFTSCSQIDLTVNGGAAYYPYYGGPALSADNSILYLVDGAGSGRVLACSVDNNVVSSECTDTGATNISGYSTGISLIKIGTTTYAYIGNGYSTNTVTVCTVNGTTLTNCIEKSGGGTTTFRSPMLAAFNPSGTIAYISDYDNGVYGCTTTPNNTGEFDDCFLAWDVSSFPIDPYGISINRNGTMGYISGYSSDVFQCPILSNGRFGTCTISTAVPNAVSNVLGY